MPFAAPNTNLPRKFSKDNANRGNGGRKVWPTDELIEVVSYDVNHQTLIGKKVSDGREMEVHIAPEKVKRQLEKIEADRAAGKTATEAGAWKGALIDANMEKSLKPGTWIVAEHAEKQKTIKIGETFRDIQEASWIHQSAANSPDKAIEGIITVNAYMGRADHAQVWHTPIDVFNNEDAVKTLAAEMDAAENGYDPEAKIFRPRMGVQFRAVLTQDKTKTVYNPESRKEDKVIGVGQVVDNSPTYDWFFQEGATQEENISRPLSGQTMLARLNAYIDYLEARFPEQAEAGLLTVEIKPYTSFKCSPADPSFAVGREGSRLHRMANTPMRLAQEMNGEAEDVYAGRNFAVKGILLIIGDKLGTDANKKPVIVPQFLAKRIFVNGVVNPLDLMLQAADGRHLELHPDLAPAPREAAPTQQADLQQAAGSVGGGFDHEADAHDNPFGTPSTDAYSETLAGVDNNGFGGGFSDEPAAPVAEAAAPAVETPAAEAPTSGLRRRRGLGNNA